ncbi:maleylpyruvate isomerase family mycothiol-dependent enzyme [Pseudonocardia spinosispora]|uniref:maleylpyruvate isomerase family mycothiol-dependent enzyme n=1 Tax=Pseudonocardia spinosispora TaxID=103441 RepID=UPI0003F5C4BA|nr:maleylpyruvate isomerase family mycothiol-dependent enzyme [Pseudonocardia spinosispora]
MPLLAGNDERFLTTAHTLTESDWAAPSLCARWTNHEVLAHLVHGLSAPIVEFSARMVGARGSFDVANAALAAELAARRAPGELLADFERGRDRRRGLGRLLPDRLMLGDHVMHELDIVFALGRPSTVAADVLASVLTTEVTVPNPFVPARHRARDLTLHATDIGWTRPGSSRWTVSGAAADLASVLAGRPHALSRLTGTGVPRLQQRLTP